LISKKPKELRDCHSLAEADSLKYYTLESKQQVKFFLQQFQILRQKFLLALRAIIFLFLPVVFYIGREMVVRGKALVIFVIVEYPQAISQVSPHFFQQQAYKFQFYLFRVLLIQFL
jgi:hypothetical protein